MGRSITWRPKSVGDNMAARLISTRWGSLLYELLTGHVPFDGESCHEIIVKHLTAAPDLGGIARALPIDDRAMP